MDADSAQRRREARLKLVIACEHKTRQLPSPQPSSTSSLPLLFSHLVFFIRDKAILASAQTPIILTPSPSMVKVDERRPRRGLPSDLGPRAKRMAPMLSPSLDGHALLPPRLSQPCLHPLVLVDPLSSDVCISLL